MKNLTIRLSLLILYVLSCTLVAFSQGNIEGFLYDVSIEGEEETLPLTTVRLYNDANSYSTVSDMDGKYMFNNIPEGGYTAEITYFGKTTTTDNVRVTSGNTAYLDLEIQAFIDPTGGYVIDITPKRGLFNPEKPNILLLESGDIENTPAITMNDLVTISPATTVDASGQVSFKGGRPGEAVYYIDEMRSEGPLNIPLSAIHTLEIMTGGIPAKYGETTSGVIVVETKSFFNAYR